MRKSDNKLEIKSRTLPQGWIEVTLDEVSKHIVDGSHNPPRKVAKGFPMLSARNITNGEISFEEVRYLTSEDFLIENERTDIQPNDVLITTVASIGRVAVVPENIEAPFAIQRSVTVIKPLIDSKYLMYAMQSPRFQKKLQESAKGTAQKGVYLNTLRHLSIPLAPNEEQQELVAKIEELFSEIDEAKKTLQRAQKLADDYKHKVLSEAFRGELTNIIDKEGLPSSWKYVKFYDLCRLQRGYDLPLSKIKKGKYPVITSGGIRGYHNEYKAIGPCLVTGRSGGVGNIHFLDVPYFWPHNTVLFVKDFCNNFPKYIYYFFLQFNFKKFSSSTTIPTLDRKRLYNEQIPLAPEKEQREVVDEIEYRFTLIDNLKKTIVSEIQKIDLLKQTVLKAAFEGELIESNSTDEQVKKLLETLKQVKLEFTLNHRNRKKKSEMGKRVKPQLLEIIKEITLDEKFTFGEMSSQISLDYKELKSQWFLLIEEKKVASFFDKRRGEIMYKLSQ